MSHIFRLHSGANNTVQDWTQISSYLDTAEIDTIKDPAGANARTQITSIPSPFARIDLVKNAFKQVVAGGQLAGTSIFHKMVSDALDVGQVFFNAGRLTGKIEIIPWNPGLSWVGREMIVDDNSDLGQLLNPQASPGQQLYGETLKMFFSQDYAAYNFDKLRQFYLINYKDGSGHLDIIGGTSPATLFFSSANNLQFVDIKFKQGRLFDNAYIPLHERGDDYILFLYSLQKAIPQFSKKFGVVDAYLEASLKQVPADIRTKILALSAADYSNAYTSIPIAGAGNHPEILGYELCGIKENTTQPQQESDFVIAATKPVAGVLPLILPAYTFTSGLRYIDGAWPAQLKAPFIDPLPVDQRILPGQIVKYPYLTVSDLLEPYLIQLPFEPNREKFFCGNLPAEEGDGFLLPLTQRFFTYFSAADLQQPGADGRPMFEFIKLPAGAVKAKLRIPVKNDRVIEVERIYHAGQVAGMPNPPDEQTNRGAISNQQLSLAIYPFVKRGTDDGASYTVMLIDRDIDPINLHRKYSLKYFKDAAPGEALRVTAQKKKSDKRQNLASTVYDIVPAEFDFITVENGKTRGCLIPLFPHSANGNQQFSFAVDFGTTNTHIEYSVDSGKPQPFEISRADMQLGMLHKNNSETYTHLLDARFGLGATLLLENVPKELMPELIGEGTGNSFPARTVISEPTNLDINTTTYPLADFSIYWQYERIVRPQQLRYHTNLKWSNISRRPEEKKRIEGYIANLVLLIRNKVVMNNGDLGRTKIVWFYPTSMSQFRLNTFEQIWNDTIERYIGPNIEQVSLPESIAPFYYFRANEGVVAGNRPVINIDIGGGTTDVVVYRNASITSFTSFKYAANSLFGDGYGSSPQSNGFVQFFEQHYRQLISETLLGGIYNELRNKGASEDIISFLFGLQANPERQSLSFSFGEKLRETNDLKIVPLIFIASILYHVAQFQKAQGGEVPRYITFSGTGSKILNILDVSRKLVSIKKLTNLIFNEVFEKTDTDIDLVLTAGPKECTAKGGLLNPQVPSFGKSVLPGMHDMQDKTAPTLREAEQPGVQKAVLQEVEYFIDRFFSWHKALNFQNEFALDVSRFEAYTLELKRDLDIYLQEGLAEKQSEMNGQIDDPIDETLFFLPLIGTLNKLSYSIAQSN